MSSPLYRISSSPVKFPAGTIPPRKLFFLSLEEKVMNSPMPWISSSPLQFPVGYIHPRKLFFPTPVAAAGAPISAARLRWGGLDGSVVAVLVVLLCGTICALALNAMVRCALRWSGRGAGGAARGRAALEGLPVLAYSSGMELVGAAAAECAICLAEFSEGERVRVLPPCNHGFHAKCVDRWLAAHSSCPYCRGCLAAAGGQQDHRRQSPSRRSAAGADDGRHPVPTRIPG